MICYMFNGSDVVCSFTARLSSVSKNAERSLVSLHPAVISADMGRVVDLKKGQQLTDHEKYHILLQHFNPDLTYHLPLVPCVRQNRSFQHTRVTDYSGPV